MEERWLPVREFPEHYEISSLGRLRRVKPYRGLYAGQIRKPQIARNGYVNFTLSVANRTLMRSAHRMVADAFLGPIPEGMQVNHKDGNKARPDVDNLEIVSNGENRAHSYRELGIAPNRGGIGPANVNARLTWDAVSVIREEHDGGRASYSVLARRFGVTKQTIARVVKRSIWREADRPRC